MTSKSIAHSVVAIAAPLATTLTEYVPASLYVKEAVSPILTVTGSAPVSPEMKSKTVAQSAVAVTLTCLDTAVSFSIVTCKFSGALNDTTKDTSAVVVKLFNPVAVTLIV